MLPRYIVEAPVELLVETPQKSCGDLVRQRMIHAEDALQSDVETLVYSHGIIQCLTVALAAKEVRLVNSFRAL